MFHVHDVAGMAFTFWKLGEMLFDVSSEPLSKSEEATINHLAETRRQVAGLDVRHQEGADACTEFLHAIEAASDALDVPPRSRTYRSTFPDIYRSLFSEEGRCYRVDVLEASLAHLSCIWMNGEKFDFSVEVSRRGEALQSAWFRLGALLEQWAKDVEADTTPDNNWYTSSRPTKAALRSVLTDLDESWADFEARYINELVDIESWARNLLVKAIEHEEQLRKLEFQHGEACIDLPEYREVLHSLVSNISHLNSVANAHRKGRNDLSDDVLLEAMAQIRQHCREEADGHSASVTLSRDLVSSFQAMRDYLQRVSKCLEKVDPHLVHNKGLVARLEDWEESWETGAAYLRQPELLKALCHTVEHMQTMQRLVPSLRSMHEECDVQLFMVLPRLVWLDFLNAPAQQEPLLARLLPHHFAPSGESDSASSVDGASVRRLQGLQQRHQDVQDLLARLSSGGSSTREGMLEQMAILGELPQQDCSACADDAQHELVKVQVADFLRELETWCYELQRHRPEDWNQCSGLLVRCLQNEVKCRSASFEV